MATTRQFKYGEKTTGDLAIEAIEKLGGCASVKEVQKYILSLHPDYKLSNTILDLNSRSVNYIRRGSAFPHGNGIPRRTDTGNSLDRLLKTAFVKMLPTSFTNLVFTAFGSCTITVSLTWVPERSVEYSNYCFFDFLVVYRVFWCLRFSQLLWQKCLILNAQQVG